jgi:hypothetical protein
MLKILSDILVAFFMGVEYARRWLRKPAAWLTIVALAVLAWGFSDSGPALLHRSRPKPLPIVFQPDPHEKLAIRHDIIESAVGRFHLRNGRLPRNWDELEGANIITKMPPPPPGKKYVLSASKMELTLAEK